VDCSIDEASGLRDKTEVLNLPKFNANFPEFFPFPFPAPVAENLDEIKQFARDLHT